MDVYRDRDVVRREYASEDRLLAERLRHERGIDVTAGSGPGRAAQRDLALLHPYGDQVKMASSARPIGTSPPLT